jgi:hypothetical protein
MSYLKWILFIVCVIFVFLPLLEKRSDDAQMKGRDT